MARGPGEGARGRSACGARGGGGGRGGSPRGAAPLEGPLPLSGGGRGPWRGRGGAGVRRRGEESPGGRLAAGREGRPGRGPPGLRGAPGVGPPARRRAKRPVGAGGSLLPGQSRGWSAVRPGCCPRARRGGTGTGSAEPCLPRGPAEAHKPSLRSVEPEGEGGILGCVSPVQSPWTGNLDQSLCVVCGRF